MSWEYSGNPAASAKDAVRFLVGDTDNSDPLLQDQEIIWLLGMYNQAPINTAIRACEAIMTKFARMANETVGQVKIDFNQKYKAYQEMRAELQRRLATEDATPFAGGISISQKHVENQNRDRVLPDFTKHMQENEQISPWVSQSLRDPDLRGP